MRKLILEEWVSLDGYATDKHGTLDFFTNLSPGENTYSDRDQLEFLKNIDLILLGRKTYALFVDYWPKVSSSEEIIADRLNEIPKAIFTNSLAETPWGKWDNADPFGGNAPEAIRKLKSEKGKGIIMWGSVSLAQELMRQNLIDEIHLQVCPTITGGGRKLFPEGLPQSELELLNVRHYPTGVTFLSYKVKK